MDLYKRAIKKEKLSHGDLSHGDLAGGGKKTRSLGGSRIVFGLTDDLTDLTEIYLLRKKSEAFSRLKNTPSNRKPIAILYRGLVVTTEVNLNRQPARNG